MIDEPVEKASGSRTKPNGWLAQTTISSASRDRCKPVSAAAARNSSAKSRSDTPSRLFAVGRSKPNAAAVAARSMAKPVPASAALPSGHSFSRAARVGEAAAVAREHGDIGHQMVAERHRLGDLQVGEARA